MTSNGFEIGGAVMIAGVSVEKGIVIMHRGQPKGQSRGYWEFGNAAGLQVDAGLKSTKYYYSGIAENFDIRTLAGWRHEINFSIGLGIKYNKSISYSKVSNSNDFVLGIGFSIGYGFPLGASLNEGFTVIDPWGKARINPGLKP